MNSEPLLVADIGGTNARFALVTGQDAGTYHLDKLRIYNSANFASFADALTAYVDSLDTAPPRQACLAVAGPVNGDTIALTNVSWRFSRSELQQQFTFTRLDVLNDFAALACAAPYLRDKELTPIKSGRVDPASVKAVVGPGTGFGVAAIAWTGERWLPLPGEGGHAGFAPGNELEIDILRRLAAGGAHVSRETLLCGRGLVRLYRTLAEIHQQPIRFDTPEQITAAASVDMPEPLCEETLRVFTGILAGAAGDIALTLGARGGVYIGGGIASQMSGFLQGPIFSERFCHKGLMSDYLADIPVYMMHHEQPALVGAAAWFYSSTPDAQANMIKGELNHG